MKPALAATLLLLQSFVSLAHAACGFWSSGCYRGTGYVYNCAIYGGCLRLLSGIAHYVTDDSLVECDLLSGFEFNTQTNSYCGWQVCSIFGVSGKCCGSNLFITGQITLTGVFADMEPAANASARSGGTPDAPPIGKNCVSNHRSRNQHDDPRNADRVALPPGEDCMDAWTVPGGTMVMERDSGDFVSIPNPEGRPPTEAEIDAAIAGCGATGEEAAKMKKGAMDFLAPRPDQLAAANRRG